MFSEVDREIEHVRSMVAARFPVYETRVTPQAVVFLVTADPATLETKFEDLRIELVPKNYIPYLTRENGEYAILIQRRPPQRFMGPRVNLVLLIVTLLTTTVAGALNWAGYADIEWLTPEAFAKGSLFFTLPLIGILSIHEMGHYIVAKRYKVHTSLPFFIPAPVAPLGTFGAMISMRDPIPNRKALIDIGASGPILGLLTAIPVTLIGLVLMSIDPRPAGVNIGGQTLIDLPPLYKALALFVPIPQGSLLHPTAFAGWVGLFVTALNLLPAGQLDGGHVARAVLGDRGKYVSWAAVVVMLGLGLVYPGWFIIAVFILLMGARHPPPLNDLTRLDTKRHLLAAAAAAVLFVSFVAVPLNIVPPEVGVQFEAVGAPGASVQELNATVTNQSITAFSFLVVNVGNVKTNVTLRIDLVDLPNLNLNASFANITIGNRSYAVRPSARVSFFLNSTEAANVTLLLNATKYERESDVSWTFHILAHLDGERVRSFDLPRPLKIYMRVASR